MFKEKEYLGKLDNQKEVEKLLEQYILRFERDPKEEPELSRFHLFDAKGNVKGVRDMEIVDYLVENVQFFVVGITPYYYEHGVCLEDHDGTSAHLYTILISKQTYLRPFNTNKDRIKAI